MTKKNSPSKRKLLMEFGDLGNGFTFDLRTGITCLNFTPDVCGIGAAAAGGAYFYSGKILMPLWMC